MTYRNLRSGFVLPIVLWTIVLLSALAMATSVAFRGFAGIISSHRDKVLSDALLNAGLEASASLIGTLGDEPLTEKHMSVSFPSGEVFIEISDESGRIDINKASTKVLLNLLQAAGAEDDAIGIVQTIDAIRLSIGHSSAIQAPDKPEGAAQQEDYGLRAFTDIRQLAPLPGMKREYFDAIRSFVTVFGNSKPDGRTAPLEVISALPGMNGENARAFIEARGDAISEEVLLQLLGPAKDYVRLKSQPVGKIELNIKLLDGYSTRAVAFITIVQGDRLPYRVLAWTPIYRASLLSYE